MSPGSRRAQMSVEFDAVVRDVRLGGRMLRKHATVTLAAVISLSLALGACVAAFSLVEALLLRPLPVRQPGQLIYLAFPTDDPERPESETFSDPVFTTLRAAARGRVDLFAMSTQVIRPAAFADAAGEQEPVRTQYVSGDAFHRLGITPAAGRLFTTDDDRAGADRVAVLSHAFWQRRFGGDRGIVGRSIAVEDRQFQIVGVSEPRFTGVEPGRPTDVWLPYATYNPRAFGNFSFNWFRVFGRVNEHARIEEAQSVLQAAFTGVRRDRAADVGPGRSADSVARFINAPLYARSAATGPSPLRREFGRPLLILAAIAALVLLIAGSNVANLFLARTAAREHEMALRLSIGAGRRRLVQQVLIESALVAGASCLLGLLFAAVAAPSVVAMLAPPDEAVHLDLRLGWQIAAFAGAITMLATALFGVVPALRASRVAPMAAMKTGGGRSAGRAGVMRPFVAIQVAFGLVVLFVGSLLVLSFARLSHVNPGFATSNVLLVSLGLGQRTDAGQQRAALVAVLDRLAGMPGVDAVGSAEFNALGRAWTHFVPIPGTAHETIEATMAPVTAGFFETMNIRPVAGRVFVRRETDAVGSAAIVINEAFAARYFGRAPAVGRTIDAPFSASDPGRHEIIGVVGDARYDLRKPAAPTIYMPLTLRNAGTLHVRVSGDPSAIAPRLRDEIRAASPLFRVTSMTTQAAAVERTLIRERLLAWLSGFFAAIGLLLAAVGLYGVLSYSVAQRTREIGIRVALGARPHRVIATVLADVGVTTLVGAICGLAGGLYLSRFVTALLYEIAPLDFWSLALPLGTLLLTALVAAVRPALRAARVDPAIALRYE